MWRILYVDDDSSTGAALTTLLKHAGYRVDFAGGGLAALAMVKTVRYDMVASDYSMPGRDGLSLLREIRTILPEAIVGLVTGDANVELFMNAVNLYHVHFIVAKPWDNKNVIATIESAFATHKKVEQPHQVSDEQVVAALSSTVRLQYPHVGQHMRQVNVVAGAIADALQLPAQQQRVIAQAALLCDLGMLAVPNNVLTKNGALTLPEKNLVQTHVEHGRVLISNFHGLDEVAAIVAQHHERWDGSGYPFGLERDAISLGAHVVGLADVFSAMIAPRPYREAEKPTHAIQSIKSHWRTSFNPTVLDAFLGIPTTSWENLSEVPN